MDRIDFGRSEWFEEKFGGYIAVPTSDVTLWDAGGLYPWSEFASAIALEILGVTADQGIVVSITGLDANFNLVTRSVTTDGSDGTTPVAITGTWARVFRAKVTSGTTTNDLQIRKASAGAVVARILHPNYQTLMSIFTIPANFTGKIVSYYSAVPKLKDAQASLYVRPFGEEFQLKHRLNVYQEYIRHDFGTPLQFGEKTDIDLRAQQSAGTETVFGGFSLLLNEIGTTSVTETD